MADDDAPRSTGAVSVTVTPDARDWAARLRAQIIPGSDEIGRELGNNIGHAMYEQFSQDVERMRLRLAVLGASDVSIRVRLDDNGAFARTDAQIAATNAAAASAGGEGGGFSLFGSRIANIGMTAIVAADVAIPAILAISAAAAGALAGVGVLALGFNGVGAAISAADQKPAGGGGGSGGGDQRRSAQINAQQATQQAADNLTSAINSQRDAQVALVKAQRDARQAQIDLNTARVQAKQDIEDLNNSLKDNAISQQQAAITLAQAKQTLAVELSAPGASLPQYASQIAQAKLDVAAAQQKSDELALTGQRLAVQDKAANAAGVEGSQKVIDAKNKVVDSTNAAVKAQTALVTASHKLVEAQANIGITAEKNRIALAASFAAGAGGADAFAAAMAKLNPLQKQFVDFWLSLKPLFDELSLAASGFFPGLERGIKDFGPAFKPLLELVGNVAKAMGSVFTQIGQALGGADGRKFLTFLATELPKQIQFLGTLFIDFGRILSGVFEAAGPLIDATDKAIVDFFDALATSSNGGGLKAFFDSLIPLVGPIGQALAAISGAVGKILAALVPAMGPLLRVISSVATEIGRLAKPVLEPLADAFGDLLDALAPLIPVFADLLEQILPPLIDALDQIINAGIAPLVQAIADALTPIIPVLGQAITDLVGALAPFIVQLIQSLVPILPTLSGLFVDILTNVIPLIPVFGRFLDKLTPLIEPLVSIMNSTLTLADTALPLLSPLIAPLTKLLDGLGKVVGPLAKVQQALADAFKDAVDWVAQLVKHFPDLTGVFKTVWGVIQPILKDMVGLAQHALDLINDISTNPFNKTTNGQGHLDPGVKTASQGTSGKNDPGAPSRGRARAAGGDVTAGEPYRVGEHGWEIFVPKVDGTIIDNNTAQKMQGAAGTVRNTQINNYGVTDPEGLTQRLVGRMAAKAI